MSRQDSTSLADYVGTGETAQWATFFLSGEMFALRVEDVQEVLMHQPLTPVPLAPEHIVGLLNLRGQVMSAVDLRKRLHFPPRPPETVTHLLVVKGREGLMSVVVDEIGDVLTLPTSGWCAPPDTLAERHRGFVFGICPIEKHVVLGLRVMALSGDEDSVRQAA
jgi:purine-binding chemotaxis protein CheW